MAKFYFLNVSFLANTAASNRALAYLRGLSEQGINTHVIFFLTDKNRHRIEQKLDNIQIEYCWDSPFYINVKGIKLLFYIFYVIRFLLKLKKGDTVYLYNMADVLHFLVKIREVKVYLEKTEHPTAYPLGSNIYRPSVKTYLQDCKKVNGIITVSTSLRKYFVENGIPQDRVHIINMIVDSSRFDGIKKNPQVEPYIAYCGTASNSKDGVDDLIKAFAMVHQKFPYLKLYIMGQIPTIMEEFGNKKLAEDLNVSDAVVFTGVIAAEDMPQMLVNSVAVALARPNNVQAQNGFPGKLGEYLLSGAPTVVTAVGDIPLFLTNMKDSLIARPNDPKNFAQKLIWVMEHPTESIVIAARGKELVAKNFNYLIESQKLANIVKR